MLCKAYLREENLFSPQLEQDLCFKSNEKIIIKIFFLAPTFIQFEKVPNEFENVHKKCVKVLLSHAACVMAIRKVRDSKGQKAAAGSYFIGAPNMFSR